MSQKYKMCTALFFFSFCQRNVRYLDEMYGEVCAFLTNNKYFELPNYRVRIFLYYDKDIKINNV